MTAPEANAPSVSYSFRAGNVVVAANGSNYKFARAGFLGVVRRRRSTPGLLPLVSRLGHQSRAGHVLVAASQQILVRPRGLSSPIARPW